MDLKKVGKFIVECRERKNLTQDDLANMLFVDRTLISKWENGKLCPDIKYFQELCNIFDVELQELIAGEIKTKSNKEELNSKAIKWFSSQRDTIKKLKLIITLLFILIFSFLGYYFLSTYNKILVYSVSGEAENFTIDDGLLVITKEKSYLSLGNISPDFDTIELYYLTDNKKSVIFSADKEIIVDDFAGYNSGINIDNYKVMIKNLYVTLKNENATESIHLDFKLSYSNSHILSKKMVPISNNHDADNNSTSFKSIKIDNCDEVICSFTDDIYELYYDTSANKLVINNDDMIADYLFDYDYFTYTSSSLNFDVHEGIINCHKNDCTEEKELYDKLYDKYIKSVIKN